MTKDLETITMTNFKQGVKKWGTQKKMIYI